MFKKYFKGDPVIWVVILLLSIFSLLAVYSSTGSLAYRYQGGNTSYYILKHATILVMGLVITYVTHLIPYKYFSRISQVLLVHCHTPAAGYPYIRGNPKPGITLAQRTRAEPYLSDFGYCQTGHCNVYSPYPFKKTGKHQGFQRSIQTHRHSPDCWFVLWCFRPIYPPPC